MCGVHLSLERKLSFRLGKMGIVCRRPLSSSATVVDGRMNGWWRWEGEGKKEEARGRKEGSRLPPTVKQTLRKKREEKETTTSTTISTGAHKSPLYLQVLPPLPQCLSPLLFFPSI